MNTLHLAHNTDMLTQAERLVDRAEAALLVLAPAADPVLMVEVTGAAVAVNGIRASPDRIRAFLGTIARTATERNRRITAITVTPQYPPLTVTA